MDKNYITNGIAGVAPTLATSATTTAVKTTTATNIKIDGSLYALPATAVMTAMTSAITVAPLSTAVLAVYAQVSIAGVISFSYALGTSVLTSAFSGTGILATSSQFPQEIPGRALLGYAVIQATSVFTGGATVIGTGNTFLFIDKFGFVGQ
jgi:hypothetical protein